MHALLLGRFQPPHRGHLTAIRDAARRFERVYVAVGSSQRSHEAANPFTVGERFDLLRAGLREARVRNVHLFAVPDIYRHAGWVRHVETLVPAFQAVVTNNPITRRLFAQAGYRVVPGRVWRPDECSGRRIRSRWAKGQDTERFVTPAVQQVLDQIRGVERVKELAKEGRDGTTRRAP